jgi:transketolase
MTVLSPCDATQAQKAVIAAIEQVQGPVYIRYGREAMPDFTTSDMDFTVGKAQVLRQGKHCVIIATGNMVWEALVAADILDKENISCTLINLHTIKPIDKETIIQFASLCGAVVTAEEHQIHGGMGSAVCEVLAQDTPVPVELVGMPDCFGESGKPYELMEKYGMTSTHIVRSVKKVIERKLSVVNKFC